MHAQWRSGDVDQLWKKLGVEFRDEYPALYKTINSDRNAAWVPLLRKRLDAPGTDDTLVVVGALHLLGQGRRGRTPEGAGLHGRARVLGVREAVVRAWPR